MSITLVGEIVNSCDATTGFSTGNISGDDDFVEGSGAIGNKTSNTTVEMYTTSLGATAPYDFSSGGSEFGWHIICWFNTKTPINATSGLRIIVGNGTSRGNWYVIPSGFYKGGFITRVVNTARNFDTITAGSWSTSGNPAQLSNITQMGGGFTTTTSIMGSFNNTQLDQFTIGLGVRADAGTVGSPNTFETVRAQDEDTNFWGWWSSKNGQVVGKGKLYIGPSTGSATSVFTDSAFSVVFANELVAVGFYEINTRGGGTDVTWTLGTISSAAPSTVRWSITIQSDTNSFDATDCIFNGADQITLQSVATLLRCTFINCTKITQNTAVITDCTILTANTADDVAFIVSNDPSKISGCNFTFSDGHAIEITAAGTYTFSGNTFTDYLGTPGTNLTPSSGSTDAAIYNTSGGSVTLNITSGGNSPSVRNAASSTTTINISVSLEVNQLTEGTRVFIVGNGGAEDGVTLLEGYANSSGVLTGSFGGSTPQNVIVRARNSGIIAAAIQEDNGTGFTDFTNDARDKTGTNDVSLYPATVSTNDAFYFGGKNPFGQIEIDVTTAGTTYVLTWEYWNGAWTALSVTDASGSFQNTGWYEITFTKPGDWATTTINSQGPFYYVRARITTGGGTSPKAEEITLNKTIKYQPFQVNGTIATGSGLTVSAVWVEDTTAR